MDHVRHSGLFSVPRHFEVGLVGAGGIGAMSALMLAKMGVRHLSVWDDDVISHENLAVQLHPVSDVGNLKVYSLAQTLERFSDEIRPIAHPERIGRDISAGFAAFDGQHYDLFITAVDSITARQDIWGEIIPHQCDIDWWLDMRMSLEQYQHFLVNMHKIGEVERYAQMLMVLKEDEVPEEVCTMKSTFYTAAFASGHAGKVLRDIVRSEAQSHRLIHYISQNTIYQFAI